MANEFYRAGQFLTIVLDGASDWDSRAEIDPAGYFPVGMRMKHVQFKVATAGGACIIREQGADSNVKILDATDLDGSGRALGLDCIGVSHPAIKASDMAAGDIVNIHFA